MHFDYLPLLNPGHGPRWHGLWKKGMIERNRRIYDFELVYFSGGNGRVITEQETFFCSRGSVIILPPNRIHCTIADSAVERWCIHFDWKNDCPAHGRKDTIYVFEDSRNAFQPSLCASVPEELPVSFPYFTEKVSPEMLPLLREFFTFYPDSLASELKYQSMLLRILSLALGNKKTAERKRSGGGNRYFFMAKNFIDSCYPDPDLNLSAIAEKVPVTPNHLEKLFRKELGMSVNKYILHRRLAQATHLLISSGMTVRETAFASGFNSPNYFTRIFRKTLGVTPTAYIAANLP
ncbi:MAG: Arabinose operon regulatory protein [Lentisphaerae bacterium ADurb.Bin242]|nr:MAG: Arabinose operon regulatory protein [Lentisphaerae bacterium ADurb.Bin242]